MPSAYDYLREEEERRRRALLMSAQDPVPARAAPLGSTPETATDLGPIPQDVLDRTLLVRRPRRVFEKPPEPGTAGRPRYTDPITYDTSGMPERRANNYGGDQMDTALKYREALENWKPSGERSLGNTARGAGYGVLTAAQQFPGSPEAMIGGGIAGLLGSLVKPSTKNWLRRGMAIPEADAEVARQLKIAGEQAKLRQMEVNPYLREIGLNQGQQRIDLNRERMGQQNLLAHKRALASIFNSYPEFDPDDPKNAAIVSAMNAVGLPVTKKTRGSLLQLVQGTDADGNATFSIVHKPTGTATQVTGEGLPAKTEGQFNREAAAERTEYTQEQINQRAEDKDRGGGLTPYQKLQRRDAANALIAKIKSARQQGEELFKKANADPRYRDYYMGERDKLLKEGTDAAFELNEKFGDLYEAGPGDADSTGTRWPYWKEKAQSREDPKIRAYADQYFGGNYDAAVRAIQKQRGQ